MNRILHVITGLNTGGAETVLCRLLESMRLFEFEPIVVALGQSGTLSERVARVATLHHLGMRSSRVHPGDLFRLRRIIRASQPDVVQGWMYHANLLATLATRGMGVPVAWGIRHSLHDLPHEKRATRLVIRANAWLSRLPECIVYNSAASASQHVAFGFSGRQIETIPNGYDVQAFLPDAEARQRVRRELGIAPDALAIGLVARVHPVKDHANFLRAAALFARKRPDAVFVLVGDGTEHDRFALSGLVDELCLTGRVRLCGRRSDVAAIDNAIDIASSSSCAEAFPNAIAEAMACGTPCVATDVGDVRNIIGDSGVTVPSRDPGALAEGWEMLAALDAGARHTMGVRARARIVERYSIATMTKRYADLYTELSGAGSRCAA